jgi:hypothetical protein
MINKMMNQPKQIKNTLLFVMMIISIHALAQTSELQGKWILDKVVTNKGEPLEINNERYSNELIYSIKPNELQINDQKFKAQFSTSKIKTPFRSINYSFEGNYLKISDPSIDRIEYFLKADKYVAKYPEFKMKEIVREQDTLLVANAITDYDFNNELILDDFINKNMPIRESKKYNNLYFKIEFVLTKENKIKEIKILEPISPEFDNNYLKALKKAAPFFKNNTNKNLVIHIEKHYVQFYEDREDPNERKLHEILLKAYALYRNNKFEEAIVEYNKIKALPIKNNHYKMTINDALKNLAISYLATGNQNLACENFKLVGNITDFSVRNYLLDFCKEE